MPTMNQERVIIRTGADTFDVIAGYKLNTEPLSLADANRLARRSSASVMSVVGQLVTPYTPPTRAPVAGSDDYDRRRRRDAADAPPRR
jgi:hypothetical protein